MSSWVTADPRRQTRTFSMDIDEIIYAINGDFKHQKAQIKRKKEKSKSSNQKEKRKKGSALDIGIIV